MEHSVFKENGHCTVDHFYTKILTLWYTVKKIKKWGAVVLVFINPNMFSQKMSYIGPEIHPPPSVEF